MYLLYSDTRKLAVLDEDGNKVSHVVGCDPTLGYYVRYVDMGQEGKVQSLKVERIYKSFKLIDEITGEQILK